MEYIQMDTPNKLPRSCLVKVQSVYPVLKQAERKAADYLLSEPDSLAKSTIADASALSGCSESTWFRLAKRLGYTGYHEMKSCLEQHLSSMESQEEADLFYDDISIRNTPREVAIRVFESTICSLRDTLDLMEDKQYRAAVSAMLGASTIVFSATGDSFNVVSSAYYKMLRAGFSVYAYPDQDLQLIAISRMKPGDVLVAVSYSGKTKNILDQVKYARSLGITVISITNFPVSPLCKNSDIVLLTAVFASNFQGEIISKRVTQMCLFESLYINLLLRTNKDTYHAMQKAGRALGKNKL